MICGPFEMSCWTELTEGDEDVSMSAPAPLAVHMRACVSNVHGKRVACPQPIFWKWAVLGTQRCQARCDWVRHCRMPPLSPSLSAETNRLPLNGQAGRRCHDLHLVLCALVPSSGTGLAHVPNCLDWNAMLDGAWTRLTVAWIFHVHVSATNHPST